MAILQGDVFGWNEKNAKNIPEKAGVYVLYDENGKTLYVGESGNLRERFTNYWNTNFEEDKCKQTTKTYQREFTQNHIARQNELLKWFKEKFGKLPPCNEKIG